VEPRFLPAGDTAVVVEFGNYVDRAISEAVLALSARVRTARTRGVRETVPTYRSLLVHFDPLVTSNAEITADIRKLLGQPDEARKAATLWRVPACFDATHAPDLREVAERAGITEDNVVQILSETLFHVYMVGFSPGFPYMGDVPPPLDLPRRTDPRVKVPAGSIAIAVGMIGIYPVESPGGWHLVGTSPIRLFDLRESRPALLAPGDKVRFEPVSASAFDEIRAAAAEHAYRVPSETMTA
jgi:inhibitor of KinA